MRRFLAGLLVAVALCAMPARAGIMQMMGVGPPPTVGSGPCASVTTTWNPSDKGSGITLSGGNLVATGGGSGWFAVRSTNSHSSGKWYYEVTLTTYAGTVTSMTAGVANSTSSLTNFIGNDANGASLVDDNRVFYNGSSPGSDFTYQTSGDVVRIAYDIDNHVIQFAKNAGAFTSTTLSGTVSGAVFAAFADNTTANVMTANFGATAFTGTPPGGYNACF